MLIDTGPARVSAPNFDKVQCILDGVHDSLPENPTQAQIDSALVQVITGELRTPKTMNAVRSRWCVLWPLIAPLATRDPAAFDALFLEYLDRHSLLVE